MTLSFVPSCITRQLLLWAFWNQYSQKQPSSKGCVGGSCAVCLWCMARCGKSSVFGVICELRLVMDSSASVEQKQEFKAL